MCVSVHVPLPVSGECCGLSSTDRQLVTYKPLHTVTITPASICCSFESHVMDPAK